LMGQTTFRLVYGVEAIMPMEYIVPSLCIGMLIGMTNRRALEEQLAQLDELEEERPLVGFHQQVIKQCEKHGMKQGCVIGSMAAWRELRYQGINCAGQSESDR